MLEFIVLGKIPGTEIVLSFATIAPIVIGLTLSVTAYYKLGFSMRSYRKMYQRIIEISL